MEVTKDIAHYEGLRRHMLGVYNRMTGGLALSGLLAWLVSSAGLTQALATGGTGLIVALAPLAIVIYMSWRSDRISPAGASLGFWAISALFGVSLSTLFAMYELGEIVRVFFITAAAFAGLSIWGYTTKKDLGAMGSFMVMGLWGIIIASLVNIFVQSSAIHWAITYIGVIVFAGLTAWDTQKIKEMYLGCHDPRERAVQSTFGALSLYLDFVNMFLFLTRIFGGGGGSKD